MKTGQLLIILLALILAACAPARLTPSVSATDAQNTSIAVIGTAVALTQTAMPTATPLPPTFTPTPEITIVSGTPIPTLVPPPIFTPDAIQIERWQEYQTALAESILPHVPPEIVLCEWAILGQSGQELYVWAVCDSGERASTPAIIYLGTDGTIQNVKAVGYDATRNFQIRKLFPPDIQEKIFSELTSTLDEQLIRHLDQRQNHRGNPPLIILSTMPTATPLP